MSVTAATLISEMRYELKDTNSAEYNFPDAELLVYLSDAVDDLVQFITVLWPYYWMSTEYTSSATANILSGTAAYPLPTSCFSVVAVSTEDSAGTTELRDALDLERTFDSAADGYFIKGRQIYLYPTPTASVANGLTIYHIPRIVRLTSTSSNVTLADDFRIVIKEHAIIHAKARQAESAADFAGLYRKVQEQLTILMRRTNLGVRDSWSVPARPFI